MYCSLTRERLFKQSISKHVNLQLLEQLLLQERGSGAKEVSCHAWNITTDFHCNVPLGDGCIRSKTKQNKSEKMDSKFYKKKTENNFRLKLFYVFISFLKATKLALYSPCYPLPNVRLLRSPSARWRRTIFPQQCSIFRTSVYFSRGTNSSIETQLLSSVDTRCSLV